MNVLILSRYIRRGASSRVRLYQYVPYLEAHGISCTISPLLDDDYLQSLYTKGKRSRCTLLQAYWKRLLQLTTLRRYDLVLLEKELLPFLPSWGEALTFLAGTPVVVDYDDATFHAYDRHVSGIVRTLLGKKIDTVMRRAALVIVGNEYLAERASRAGAHRIEYLPSVVDCERYVPSSGNSGKVFTIGWIGTPSSARYLQKLAPALKEVCRNNLARLVLVGSGEVNLPDVPLEILPWSEATEVVDIQSFDVGIMPLEDTPWERGKCGYKLIQCMACGLPVVASPVGVNRQIVEHGTNGFLAESLDEWIRALSDLRDNHDLRIRMGSAAREQIAKNYSLQANAPRLLTLIRSAAGGT